jgi:hypothetical protein
MSKTVKTQEQHIKQQIALAKDNIAFMLKRRNVSNDASDARDSVRSLIALLRYLQTQV